METTEKSTKIEESTSKKEKPKKIKKSYVILEPSERANLKQLSKRKFISQNALKQIHALLLFDANHTMIEVMEYLGLSPQKLLGWRSDFKKYRMGSLLVVLEKQKDEEDEKDDDKSTKTE